MKISALFIRVVILVLPGLVGSLFYRKLRGGRQQKGGVNDEPKTPRPEARPQPRKPSGSSSDGGGRQRIGPV